MNITRRSFVKKTSYSAAAVTVLGTGVGLGQETTTPPKYKMKCTGQASYYSTASPAETAEWEVDGRKYRWILSLEGKTSENTDWGWYSESAVHHSAGEIAEGSVAGQSANLKKQECVASNPGPGMEWSDLGTWNAGKLNDFYEVECKESDGVITSTRSALSDDNPTASDGFNPKVELSSESTASGGATVTTKYTLTASNLSGVAAGTTLTAEITLTNTFVPAAQ